MIGFFKNLFGKMIRDARERDIREFRDKYFEFRELLDRNNAVLETISKLAEIRDRGEELPLGRLRSVVTRVYVDVYRLIQSLAFITDERNENLEAAFARLEAKLSRVLDTAVQPGLKKFSVSLEEVNRKLARDVGAKAANLGKIKQQLGLSVPRGVVITAWACKRFFDHNRLQEKVNKEKLLLDPGDVRSIATASQNLRQLVLSADLPPDLDEALQSAYRSLMERTGDDAPFIIRSSAVGEDEFGVSFAGLFKSVFNPAPEDLTTSYKEIVASKYSSRSLTYILQRGIYEELVPMCVLMMELVPAETAGILYTQDPQGNGETLVINAVRGLGRLAVDGTVDPDVIRVKRGIPMEITSRRIGNQTEMLVIGDTGSIRRRAVEKKRREKCCLEDRLIFKLAEIGVRLENLFGQPQDVEWAVDSAGVLHIVQSRPLMVDQAALAWKQWYPKQDPALTHPVLAENLRVASSGAACGRAVVLKGLPDSQSFQNGALLVVDTTHPDLVSFIPRASAVLAGRGSTTGHLAIIAREMRVPMLIGLSADLMARIEKSGEITVDAFTGKLYQGRVESLLQMTAHLERDKGTTAPMTPARRVLHEVLQYITPLNLTNPRAPSFTAQNVRTIHDMIRFAHETAINAMFEISDERLPKGSMVKRLVSDVPLNIHIIDLGGGLKNALHRKTVKPEDIVSIPMRALYRGMTTKGVRWSGHIPIDLKGFISVFANTLYDASKHERRLGDRSYAIVSLHHANFASRLGYHFSIVDAHVGPVARDNYISFRFKGGAASIEKRTRRVRFIERVLVRHDFWVDQRADLVNARIKRLPQTDMEDRLVMLGRLMGCSRQLDVTMHSDAVVEGYVARFMAGDYSMGHTENNGQNERDAV